MKIRYAIAAMGVALAGPALAQIADGSFETQGSGVGNYCYFGQTTPGGPPCPTGPWTGTTGLQNENNGPFPGTQTPAGVSYGFVQGTGTLSQSFVATQTGTFFLSWLDAGRNNQTYPGNESYSVTLNALSLGNYQTTTGQPFTARTSNVFALVTGQTYVLSFNGQTNSDQTAFIDNVVLSAAPEPGTWAMMIAGFGIAGVALRRRRAPAKRAIA